MEELFNLVKVLLLLLSTQLVSCKRYDVPSPWEIQFNPASMIRTSLPVDGAAGYMVISNGSTEIVSDNGTYALAYIGVSSSTSVYDLPANVSTIERGMLAVVMQTKSGSQISAVPVWMDGAGIYKDFTSVQLDETGNLFLYWDERLVWQSFDDSHSDILLPGQPLKSGMVSRNGNYTAQLSSSGFALYADNYQLRNLEYNLGYNYNPYQVWNVKASEENTTTAIQQQLCVGYQAVVLYTGTEVKLLYEANSTVTNQSCGLPALTLLRTRSMESLILPYLQLDSTGDLVIFHFDSASRSWTPASKLSDTLKDCKLPSEMKACGKEEIYDADRKKCYDIEQQKEFSSNYLFLGQSYKCLYTYVFVPGASHFSTKFTAPTLHNVSMEDCVPAFSFFGTNIYTMYDNILKQCKLVNTYSDHPHQVFYRDNTTHNMTAILSSQSVCNFKSVFIFVGCVAALWPLAILAFLIVKYNIPAKMNIKLRIVVAKLDKQVTPILHVLRTGAAFVKYTTINTMNYFNKAVQEMETSLSAMQGLPRRYTYMELANATQGFKIKLGAGGYGSVYEGVTQDGKHVAVKKLSVIPTQSATKQFITEVVGIGGISHLNVVKLYGFCMDGASKRLLVYDFMPNGSLDHWIFGEEEGRCLSWPQRLNIALGTARGLCYLHEECSDPILHLDVKPQNILLDENFVPKLCDFGVAKLLRNRDITHATITSAPGTLAYMAPELLIQRAATKKCDVYSYGLVLLELMGGRRNTDWNKVDECSGETGVDSSWYFPSWAAEQLKKGNVVEIWDEKVRASAVENKSHASMVVRLALWCVQSNPSIRPSFSDIVENLEGRRMVTEPPMSFHFKIRGQDLT